MSPVVISGYSCISPFGDRPEDLATKMFSGKSGIRSLENSDLLGHLPIRCAGLLPDGFYPPLKGNFFRLEVEMLLGRLLENFLSQERPFHPVDAIILGTNHGLPKFIEITEFQKNPNKVDFDALSSDFGISVLMESMRKVGQYELAPQNTLVTANGCITGLEAINYAMKRIGAGLNKRILVVCHENRIRPEELLKYNAIGALSKDPYHIASRPFSKSRSGFVKGEGAGMVVVESLENVHKRNGTVYGELLGYGQTSDAWRLTDGREDLHGMTGAMTLAIEGAGLGMDQIDYINAHGTSTQQNDRLETRGIKTVFGDRAYDIPISTLKSQIGHLNYACSIVEVIACLIMLEHQMIAPTIHFEGGDPECDLNYVPNRSAKAKLKYVLKNSFGFGGSNASLVIGCRQTS